VLTDRQTGRHRRYAQQNLPLHTGVLICWSPALVVATSDIDPRITITNLPRWFTLFVLQGLTAPMQGFLNCIVYGWSRKSFRDASEQRINYVAGIRRKAVASAIGLRTELKLESKNDDLVTLNLLDFKTTCKWNTDELQRDVKKLGGKLFIWALLCDLRKPLQ
ncbi:hypothetical protein OS493_004012, partial [Desmophyllum pertusum]